MPLATIGYHLGWQGTIWYHWLPLSTTGYHSGWQGKVLERFQVCQEANGYGRTELVSDETVTRDAYASKNRNKYDYCKIGPNYKSLATP